MHLISVLETERWDPDKQVTLIIDTERGNLVDHPALFGKTVKEAFPSASEDIRAAGNCLAAECNTAAVFHLMRVAEVGLRALARDRRVRLPRKEPLTLARWQAILRDLKSAEDAIKQYPKTRAQEAQYDFYSGAMSKFGRFKDVFCNQLVHARDHFGPRDSMRIFEDVRLFMQTLAGRIGEKSRTPLVWKGKKWTRLSGHS